MAGDVPNQSARRVVKDSIRRFKKEIERMNRLTQKLIVWMGLTAAVLAPALKADSWHQKVVFTFSGPVEILGQVLPAGTYVFKLLDSSSNRHIVQVFNEDQSRIFGMFLAIPSYRLNPTDKPIIRFDERVGDSQAIKAWFYPGQNYGHEFVYPKKEAVALAKANNEPVPAMPTELESDTRTSEAALNGPEIAALEIAVLVAEEPTGHEVEIAQAFPVRDLSASLRPVADTAEDLPEELPATASPFPLIGLGGLLALGIGGTLLAAARAK